MNTGSSARRRLNCSSARRRRTLLRRAGQGAHRSNRAIPGQARRLRRCTSRPLVDHSTLHDERHLLDRADVAGRIALHRDDVRVEARPELAEVVLLAEDLRVDRGRREQRLRGPHAVPDHPLQFLVVGAMGKHAHVAAAADGDAGGQRQLERVRGLLHRRRGWVTRFPALEIVGDRVDGLQRGQVGHVVFFYFFVHFRGAAPAMLDRVDAGQDRAAHAFGGAGMYRYREVQRVCRLDAGIQLRLGERRRGMLALAAMVVGVELDPVGTVTGLIAYRRDHFRDAGDGDAALRQWQVATKAQWTRTVAIPGDRGPRRHEQVRTGDQAFVDGALDIDIGVAGAFGAEVAQCGEARQQGGAYVAHRLDRAIRQRFVQYLVVPQRLVVGVQKDVRVRVDQARHQRGAGQVDGLRVGGSVDLRKEIAQAEWIAAGA